MVNEYDKDEKGPFLMIFFGLSQYGMAQTQPVAYYIHLVVSATNGALYSSPAIETAEIASPLDSLINSQQTEALLRKGNILDALNYFNLKGWHLVSTSCVPYSSKGDVSIRCYYLLKKELESGKADVEKLNPSPKK